MFTTKWHSGRSTLGKSRKLFEKSLGKILRGNKNSQWLNMHKDDRK